MSALEQLHHDFLALQEQLTHADMGWAPPALEPVTLTRRSEDLDGTSLPERLTAAVDAEGWLMYPDQVVILPAPFADRAMPPLAGEWRLPSGESVRLEHTGGETWRLHTATATPSTPEAATHLAEVVIHRNDRRAPAPLHYLRLWAMAADDAPAPELALFTGFQEQQA